MVIVHDKQLLERWAHIYVDKYLKESPKVAVEWAERHLSQENISALVPLVKSEFHRKGIKLKDEEDTSA